MTQPVYTPQALSHCKLPQLKRIAAELGVNPKGNKTKRQTWIDAIRSHQSAQLQKIDRPAPDNKAIAQMQLNHYISEQAQAIAPEELTPREISFFHHEYYAGDKLVAAIHYDHADFQTQRWVVVINNAEVFRAATPMMCDRYICTHYKDGTLPVQEQETPCTTGNEIMAQIAGVCEQYGLELLDDGSIYLNNEKLGEVGCISNNSQLFWFFKRESYAPQKPIFCDSAADAVWLLQISDELPCTDAYLQYHPLEQLSAAELRRLFDAAELVGV